MNPYKALWLVFVGVWVIAAANRKRTTRKEPIHGAILHRSLLVVAVVLLFYASYIPFLGMLTTRWIPQSGFVNSVGLAVESAGLAIAIWARLILGANWSGAVTIKEDHPLVRRGPYRYVRHPIYSGIVLAMLGNAIGGGNIAGFLAIPIALLGFSIKWRVEERFLTQQFGDQYVCYQREVRAVIPGVL